MVRAAGHKGRWLTATHGSFLLRATHSLFLLARTPLRTTPRGSFASGGEGRALILDTEGTFRPERIMEISKRFDLNGEDVLNNIRVSRVRYSSVTRTRPPSQRVCRSSPCTYCAACRR